MSVVEEVFKMTKQEAREVAAKRKELVGLLKRVLIDKLSLNLETNEISEDAPLFGTGLGLDSIDALEIVVAVEDKFSVAITDDDMAVFRSLNTIADFVAENRLEA